MNQDRRLTGWASSKATRHVECRVKIDGGWSACLETVHFCATAYVYGGVLVVGTRQKLDIPFVSLFCSSSSALHFISSASFSSSLSFSLCIFFLGIIARHSFRCYLPAAYFLCPLQLLVCSFRCLTAVFSPGSNNSFSRLSFLNIKINYSSNTTS